MSNKTLLLTGASSGIGEATARAATDAGWNVGLFARSEDKLKNLQQDLGETAMVLAGDVTDYSSIEDAAEKLAERFGSIDAVFANAGKGVDAPGTESGDVDEWSTLIDINIKGLLYTVKASLPYLKDTKGHVVLTGSAAGRIHLSGSVYGASKWFVHGYGGNLANEMSDWGGRCTVIAPGMVNTAFFDEEKPDKLQPEDVARSVVHALEADPRANIREIFVMPTN